MRAALITAFDGTQPMLERSPPIPWLSTGATRPFREGSGRVDAPGRRVVGRSAKPLIVLSIFCKNPHCPRGVQSVIATCRENPTDRKRQQLLLRQLREILHADVPSTSVPAASNLNQ
jgi:hypothetical protein